jgi:hypothetical protein
MELGKPRHPSPWEQGSRVQDHATMNARVLNNLFTRFRRNEQKVIVRTKRHTFLEWDRLQVYLQYTLEMFKPALVGLTSNHIFQLLGMTTWGVGAIPLNVQAKLKCNEDLALVIQATRIRYAKALRGASMEHDWKSTSNKTMRHKQIGLLTQYYDLELIHGW